MSPAAIRKAIFVDALEISDPAARDAFLTQACKGDAALREQIEALLHVQQHAKAGFMERPRSDTSAQLIFQAIPAAREAQLAESEAPGTAIGRYTLLHKLGEGGMGAVFAAQQLVPMKRTVALKIIKNGMNGPAAAARFETEFQALALMDHPSIAKVHDAGATATGAPYFVMELIDGIPIVAFCDERRMTVSERLNMFVGLCDAIQHAHQKGIIHRDIKPSNVLVTRSTDKPIPKVIDFGVAKAIDRSLSENALETMAGTILGTLEYMSPEQADMNPARVDTRSDVYALGVLLYELLTGSTPLGPMRAKKTEFLELIRALRDDDPPKPSARILELSAEVRAGVAERRSVEPMQLVRCVSGELDWIATKALEKDRARRYGSPAELARDVERYLNDEPLEVGPPSGWYRISKLVRRNKWPFTAAAALAIALLIGVVASAYLYYQEREARKLAVAHEREQERLRGVADAARANAEAAKASAEASAAKAATEAAKSRQVALFMQGIFWEGIKPENAVAHDTALLREILERSATRLDTKLKGQPEVQAQVTRSLAEAYTAIGDNVRAEAMRRKVVELLRGVPGDHAFEFSRALCELGIEISDRNPQEAEAVLKEALAISHGSVDADQVHIFALWAMGYVLHATKRPEEAERLYRDALALVSPDDHAKKSTSLDRLANVLKDLKKKNELEAVLNESRAECARIDALPKDPTVALHYANLASAIRNCGEIRECAETQLKGAEIMRQFLGSTHVTTAEFVFKLGKYRLEANELAEGLERLRESVQLQAKVFGERHAKTQSRATDILTALLGKCETLMKSGRGADAEPIAREGVALCEKYFSTTTDAHVVRSVLARCLWAQNKLADAEELFVAAAEFFTAPNKSKAGFELQRARRAVRYLLEFYSATNQPEKMNKWKQQQAALEQIRSPAER